MAERSEGEGGEVPAQVWEALVGVAEAAAGRKQGREAIARMARQLSTMPGGEAVAMRLAAIAKPGGACALAGQTGWVGRMWRDGKLTAAEYRAAQDIGRGVEQMVGAAADGLRAVDPTRLVVDGGKVAAPSLGGATCSRPEAERVATWLGEVRSRPAPRAVVNGSRARMPVDELVLKVIVEGTAPLTLAAQLGVKAERPQQVVLAELRCYAKMHFPA